MLPGTLRGLESRETSPPPPPVPWEDLGRRNPWRHLSLPPITSVLTIPFPSRWPVTLLYWLQERESPVNLEIMFCLNYCKGGREGRGRGFHWWSFSQQEGQQEKGGMPRAEKVRLWAVDDSWNLGWRERCPKWRVFSMSWNVVARSLLPIGIKRLGKVKGALTCFYIALFSHCLFVL